MQVQIKFKQHKSQNELTRF